MKDLNDVKCTGRLTSDPVQKTINGNKTIALFSLAIDQSYVSQHQKTQKVSFVSCIAWSKTAEIILKYAKKGAKVLIGGEINQKRWQEKETGNNKSSIEINVNYFLMLGEKKSPTQESAQINFDDAIPVWDEGKPAF